MQQCSPARSPSSPARAGDGCAAPEGDEDIIPGFDTLAQIARLTPRHPSKIERILTAVGATVNIAVLLYLLIAVIVAIW